MNASVKRLEETGTALRDALTQQNWSAIGMLDRECRSAVDEAMREHQRDDGAGHHQNHRDAAVIGGQLAQDSRGGRRVSLEAHPALACVVLRRMTDRNASSSDVHPLSISYKKASDILKLPLTFSFDRESVRS